MKKLTSILFVLLIVCFCKTPKSNLTESQIPSITKNSGVLMYDSLEELKKNSYLSLFTTSCFGECPVFELYYLQDSLLLLSSKEHLLEEGEYYYHLSQADKKEINSLLDLPWDSFEDTYKTMMNDLPAYTFQIRSAKGLKSIRILGEEPAELRNLKRQILEKIKVIEWIRFESGE